MTAPISALLLAPRNAEDSLSLHPQHRNQGLWEAAMFRHAKSPWLACPKARFMLQLKSSSMEEREKKRLKAVEWVVGAQCQTGMAGAAEEGK